MNVFKSRDTLFTMSSSLAVNWIAPEKIKTCVLIFGIYKTNSNIKDEFKLWEYGKKNKRRFFSSFSKVQAVIVN